jgi:hypothetical protein
VHRSLVLSIGLSIAFKEVIRPQRLGNETRPQRHDSASRSYTPTVNRRSHRQPNSIPRVFVAAREQQLRKEKKGALMDPAVKRSIHCLRDPTGGGVVTTPTKSPPV